MFSPSDIEYIRSRGTTEERIAQQIDRFRRGATTLILDRPATVGDGIVRVAEDEKERLLSLHEGAARAGRCLKFVPASGAATRMFKDWHAALNRGGFGSPAEFDVFAESLPRYAFHGDLREILSNAGLGEAKPGSAGAEREILDFILNEKGLNYACKPKALLKFHRYGDAARTALEEHLVEAALYVKDGQGLCRVHVTVSAEHLEPVRELIGKVRGDYERRFGVRYEIGSPTERVYGHDPVDLDNQPRSAPRDGVSCSARGTARC
jgi:hypothetical protein